MLLTPTQKIYTRVVGEEAVAAATKADAAAAKAAKK